jgi:ribonuclease HII
MPSTSIIKGDAKSITIAAASVIAKVTRDKMMYELDKSYPMYGFGKHKGYPTKKHLEALKKYGILDGYRLTYKPVKDILEENLSK